ncbi:MAG: hypothetical protein AAGA91_02400 [Pseudomonadota bacterium]
MTHAGSLLGSKNRYRLFISVKYLVYLLLSFNVYLFLQEELAALEHTFIDGFEPGQIIQVFSATIDTGAWVVLLLLFELETWVLDDKYLRGATKLAIHGLRGICYIAIVYAFTGYFAELLMLYQVSPLVDACALVSADFSLLVDLDEYVPLEAANCLLPAQGVQIDGFTIVADANTLQSARWLAWTDVINSGTWILICLLLEIEVRLQLRGAPSGRVVGINKVFKFTLYGILFAAAAYWGVAGDFLDFWDAALWLFAFIFIELNVFEWQQESLEAIAEPH